jgi:hypothetical protein
MDYLGLRGRQRNWGVMRDSPLALFDEPGGYFPWKWSQRCALAVWLAFGFLLLSPRLPEDGLLLAKFSARAPEVGGARWAQRGVFQ